MSKEAIETVLKLGAIYVAQAVMAFFVADNWTGRIFGFVWTAGGLTAMIWWHTRRRT